MKRFPKMLFFYIETRMETLSVEVFGYVTSEFFLHVLYEIL